MLYDTPNQDERAALYDKALRYFQSGQYKKASALFGQLGAYCYSYQYAVYSEGLMYETMADQQKYFLSDEYLSDYPNREGTYFISGRNLLGYYQAARRYVHVWRFKDSARRAESCVRRFTDGLRAEVHADLSLFDRSWTTSEPFIPLFLEGKIDAMEMMKIKNANYYDLMFAEKVARIKANPAGSTAAHSYNPFD